MVLAIVCPFCGKTSYVVVPEKGFQDWQAGALIQDAMPELSADERELLISGICPECWDNMFCE